MPHNYPVCRSPRCAFSLIELLVVIAIIGVLSLFVVPLIGQVRKNTEKLQSASNLRQVGLAMLTYAGENNGVLPGPLWVGMHTYAKSEDRKLLGTLLAPYLAVTLPEDPKEIVQVPALICPRWHSLTTNTRGKPWEMAGNAELLNGNKVPPFGNSNRSPVALSDLRAPELAPAMTHRDGNDSGVSKPVFDTIRLRLYLDAHVDEIAVQ